MTTSAPEPPADVEPPLPEQPGHGITIAPPAPPPVVAAPPPPWWRQRRTHIIAGVVLALIVFGALLPDQPEMPDATPTPPRTSSPTEASPFDTASWEAFIATGAVPASVVDVIDTIRWNGVSLVAETSIVDDADAPATARAVCMALSGYLLQHGGFEPVQVVAADGSPLVARANLSESC